MKNNSSRFPIRLLLREHGIPGGCETVNIQLVKEFAELVDLVVWVMPISRLNYFQQILPPSDRLIYEPQFWSRETWIQNSAKKAEAFVRQKSPQTHPTVQNLRHALWDLRLKWIVHRYKITHSFCSWVHVTVPRINVPTGVMVMDVMWKHFPDSFGHGTQDWVDCRFRNWLKKAAVLFPVSETTTQDIKRFYPWYNGPIRVVPHGALSEQCNGGSSAPSPETSDSRPIFYYPARAGINKDHLTLFKACEKLFAKGLDFDLVLTGHNTEHFANRHPYDDDNAIEACRASLQANRILFQGRIKSRGYCTRSEVDSLYKCCTAVVLPSTFEGFGLPLIEALESGAEIICSDIPPYREQLLRHHCEDQVRLFPAGDSTALAAEMEKVLIASRQPLWRKRSQSGAFERWTWKDAATAYLESLAALTPA
ncbi:MAG TPA: glycosyltransferase [Chthoniobacterales bacterium]